MNKYTASEVAYQNGYKMGLKVKQENYSEQFAKGFFSAQREGSDPMDFCGVLCDFAEELIRKYEINAIKKFADRLKKDLIGWETDPTDEEIEWVIDNLTKKMVNDYEN